MSRGRRRANIQRKRAEVEPRRQPTDATEQPQTGPEGQVVALSLEAFSGTLPHPDHAERYEQLLPGTMDRFLGMVERRTDAAIQAERDFIRTEELIINAELAERRSERRFEFTGRIMGTAVGLSIGLGAILAYTYLKVNGHNTSDFWQLFIPLAILVAVFAAPQIVTLAAEWRAGSQSESKPTSKPGK